MHICKYGNAPNCLKDILIKVHHVQLRFTRASNDVMWHVLIRNCIRSLFYITDYVSGIRYVCGIHFKGIILIGEF